MRLKNKKCSTNSTKRNENKTLQTAFKNIFFPSEENVQAAKVIAPANSLSDRWNKVYRVALNSCGSLILRIADFLCFAGTNLCDWKRLVFLAAGN